MAYTPAKFGGRFSGGYSPNQIGPVRFGRPEQTRIPIQPANYFSRNIPLTLTNIGAKKDLSTRTGTIDPSITTPSRFKPPSAPPVAPPPAATPSATYLPDLVSPVLTNIQARGGLPRDTPYNELFVMFAPVRAAMGRNRLWANRILGELGLPLSWARTINADSRQQRAFYEALRDYLYKNYKDITLPKTTGPTTPTGRTMV